MDNFFDGHFLTKWADIFIDKNIKIREDLLLFLNDSTTSILYENYSDVQDWFNWFNTYYNLALEIKKSNIFIDFDKIEQGHDIPKDRVELIIRSYKLFLLFWHECFPKLIELIFLYEKYNFDLYGYVFNLISCWQITQFAISFINEFIDVGSAKFTSNSNIPNTETECTDIIINYIKLNSVYSNVFITWYCIRNGIDETNCSIDMALDKWIRTLKHIPIRTLKMMVLCLYNYDHLNKYIAILK